MYCFFYQPFPISGPRNKGGFQKRCIPKFSKTKSSSCQGPRCFLSRGIFKHHNWYTIPLLSLCYMSLPSHVFKLKKNFTDRWAPTMVFYRSCMTQTRDNIEGQNCMWCCKSMDVFKKLRNAGVDTVIYYNRMDERWRWCWTFISGLCMTDNKFCVWHSYRLNHSSNLCQTGVDKSNVYDNISFIQANKKPFRYWMFTKEVSFGIFICILASL